MAKPAAAAQQLQPGIETRRFVYPSTGRFLAHAASLEEPGSPNTASAVCILTLLLLLAAIVVAALFKIEVFSATTGQIVPLGHNHIVQVPERGTIGKIWIEEGTKVAKNDLLLEIASPEIEAERVQLQTRRAALEAKAGRLRHLAFASSRPLAAAAQAEPSVQAALADQLRLLGLDELASLSEGRVGEAEVARLSAMLVAKRKAREALTRQIDIASNSFAIKQQLKRQHLAIVDDVAAAERATLALRADLAQTDGEIAGLAEQVTEARQRIDRGSTLSRQHYGTELSEVSIALAEIHNDLRAVEARLERNRLRAPFEGVVHNLISSRPGAVVEQGQPLLELVPAHGTLIAEISIPTTEIAHVRIGQQARIAIDGVEPQRHGYIIGRLAQLSPSTFVHAEDRPYYRGRINFDLTQPDDVVGRHLVPGMTITAEINIGERTILEYMLKPIYRAWNQAFHER